MAADPSVIEALGKKKYVSYDNLKKIKEKFDLIYAKSTDIPTNVVTSINVNQIKIVTEYPEVEEANVLYLKVE